MKYSKIILTFAIILSIVSITNHVKAVTIDLDKGIAMPPEAIGNMSVPFYSTNTATLRWDVSDPSVDDGVTYDIRYSESVINSSNFSDAKKAQDKKISVSDVKRNDTERMYTVSNLTPGKTYYFALKSKNDFSDWSQLSDVASISLPKDAPTSSTFPNTNIGFGSRGETVSDLQKFLKDQGYFNGTYTTFFGSMTKNAVIAFQKKNNITPATGYVGPFTRKIIQDILAKAK